MSDRPGIWTSVSKFQVFILLITRTLPFHPGRVYHQLVAEHWRIKISDTPESGTCDWLGSLQGAGPELFLTHASRLLCASADYYGTPLPRKSSAQPARLWVLLSLFMAIADQLAEERHSEWTHMRSGESLARSAELPTWPADSGEIFLDPLSLGVVCNKY